MPSSRARIDVSPQAQRAKHALLDRFSAGGADFDQLVNLIGDLHRELHSERESTKDALAPNHQKLIT
jgi:hypothetical protein